MTATFKVVEFYRLNNTVSGQNSISNDSNLTLKLIENSSFDESNTSPTDIISKKTFPTTQSSSSISTSIHTNGANSIYNTLGFNVLGGYLTDFPATIIDVANNTNGKNIKVFIFPFFLLFN